jgi:hypothetical protein
MCFMEQLNMKWIPKMYSVYPWHSRSHLPSSSWTCLSHTLIPLNSNRLAYNRTPQTPHMKYYTWKWDGTYMHILGGKAPPVPWLLSCTWAAACPPHPVLPLVFHSWVRPRGGHSLMKFKTMCVQILLPLCYMLRIIQKFIKFFVQL